MINRRQFIHNVGLVGGLAMLKPGISFAQDAATVRLGNASGVVDAQLVFMTVGQHPDVNYYEREGVALDIINMSGAGQTLQAIASGNCETSAISPVAFLNAYAGNPELDVVFPYCWLREPHWSVAVKPDSELQNLSELRGKRIGIRNQGDTGYFGARAMFEEIGIDPDADVEWVPVGEGGPAGEAVYGGRVEAMAYWDGGFARVEIAGYPLRHLPNTAGMDELFGNSYGVQKSSLDEQRDTVIRFFRAMAKSTIFAHHNLEQAVRLHWDIYPESKPRGVSEEQAMEDAMVILNARADKWMPKETQPDQRFGAHSESQWRAMVKFTGLQDEIDDVSGVSTTDLLDEINDFDRDEIIAESAALTR